MGCENSFEDGHRDDSNEYTNMSDKKEDIKCVIIPHGRMLCLKKTSRLSAKNVPKINMRHDLFRKNVFLNSVVRHTIFSNSRSCHCLTHLR